MKRKNKRKYEEGGTAGGTMQVRTRLNTMPRIDQVQEPFPFLPPLAEMALQHPLAPHNILGGGMLGGMMMKNGGHTDPLKQALQQNTLSHRDSVAHQADKILKYEQLRGGPGGRPLPSYSDPRYKAMLMDDIYPEINKIMPNASAMEKGEAMDYVFNAGWDKKNKKIKRDPRSYALQEYYRKYDPSKLDKDGKWAGRKGAPYTFDAEYNRTIGKLPENERRVLMNKGRDWYYQNINTKPDGSPSDNYADTWYGRIWNTNDFSEFNPNNPKFRPQKAFGGNAQNRKTIDEIARLNYNDALQRADTQRMAGIPFFGYGPREQHITEGPRTQT